MPELTNAAPFRAAPLLVSGTDAYRDGEYLYQDYLFDDHGADTTSQLGSRRPPLADTTGDVAYPTGDRYRSDAADIVEVRVKPTPRTVTYRITLNTVIAPDTAIVGIGIDTDRSGGSAVTWPGGAGLATPGLDAFIAAWGTGGAVYRPVSGKPRLLGSTAVTMDTSSNQMTIRVPRSILDPGTQVWRYVVGAGLRSSANTWQQIPASTTPTSSEPASGSADKPAPAVFNLAFRYDEPQGVLSLDSQTLGVGIWFEDEQARTLATGETGGLFADVDFAVLAAGADRWIHAPGATESRIHASRLDLPEGMTPDGMYGGRLQPYILHVPPACDPQDPPGLTLALHGANATHTQWSVFSPHYFEQLGDARNDYVLSPLKRSLCCYQPDWYADVFEAWADVAHRFVLDPDRVTLSGYSAGGYDTYRLGFEYPDLFSDAFPIVGAAVPGLDAISPGTSDNYRPMTGNARWLPYLSWNEVTDEAMAGIGGAYSNTAFNDLGLRNQLWLFSPGEHLTPALVDQWGAATDVLGHERAVVRDPHRVDYTIAPVQWRPGLSLVADHAYWVSGLRLRDADLLDDTNTARGSLSAVSRAFGQGDAPATPIASLYAGLPGAAVITGTDWGATPVRPAENRLDVTLHNLSSATVNGPRARLSGQRPVTIEITSDGSGVLRLDLPLPKGTTGVGGWVELSPDGAVLHYEPGTHIFVLTPPGWNR